MSTDFAKVICFDMEMCCWSERKGLGEIISIGICELNLHNGKVEREAHYYVKPVYDEVSEFCQSLTDALAKAGATFQGRAHNALTDAKNLATLITKAQLI